MKKRRLISIIALAITATLTLTSCGTDVTTIPTTKPNETSTSVPSETTTPSTSPTKYSQSPFLDDKGLPTVDDRLPEQPKITNELTNEQLKYEIGQYGGTLRLATTNTGGDSDGFCMLNEPLVNVSGVFGTEVTPNILQNFESNTENTEFTFTLRKGLKWSDGEAVTMDDFKFAYENVLKNSQLYPVFPEWMKSGGTTEGTPMEVEYIDDWNFKVKFDKPYGGFLVNMAIVGWRGYTDLLKPSHYLKQFHKDFPEYNEEKANEIAKTNAFAEDKDKWINVFNTVDISNWEMNTKNAIGFPTLSPWFVKEHTNEFINYERNPYYFKVDSAGNQLPYIDNIYTEGVNDEETRTMKNLAGETDFASVTLSNMPMYKENEKNGYVVRLVDNHITPTDISLNMTYEDETFQLVTRNLSFRKALNYAIDRDEIIDAVYFGYAEPSKILDAEFSVDKANALLDEMGMDKKDKSGMRLAPNGKPFSALIEVAAEAMDIVPVGELVTEMWKDVGIKVDLKRIEGSLIANKQAANELQGRIMWTHTPLWYMKDWGYDMWGRSWSVWKSNAKEATITKEDGTTEKIAIKGEEPPAEVKEFYNLVDQLLIDSPKQADETIAKVHKNLKDNVWYFPYLNKAKVPLITNDKMGNVDTKDVPSIGFAFSGEQFFFRK